MRWRGQVAIPPAFSVVNQANAGQTYSANLEQIPSGGDVPRPSERWALTNIYLPAAVAVTNPTSTLPTVARVQIFLMKSGIQVWSTSTEIAIVPNTTTSGSGNVILSEDFTNPLILYSGDAQMTLASSAVIDQSLGATGVFLLYVGYQTLVISGVINSPPAPGTITYQATSLDDPGLASDSYAFT